MNTLHFAGADLIIDAETLTPDLFEALTDCGGPGHADEAVAYVRSQFAVTGDEGDCRGYLKGYGAWDDDELSDHDENLDRLVWLTGCSLADGEPAYFSRYS